MASTLMGKTVLAADTFPDFPMSFWGAVHINSLLAPEGTIIRAYYGNLIGGQAIVQKDGAYGYADAAKQKLIVGEGAGMITFTIQSSSINNGAETKGTNIQSYVNFISGLSVNQDLNFDIVLPTTTTSSTTTTTTIPPTTTTTVHTSGGGRSGGYIPPSTTVTTATTKSGTITTATKPIGKVLGATIGPVTIPILPPNPTLTDYQNLLAALIQQLAYLQSLQPTQSSTSEASHYQFNSNLQFGDSGEDVRQLQMFLQTQGTNIYPEGLVTGYFGSLTKRAVERFQVKYGIANLGEAGYGLVGPRTRTKINSL